MTDKKGISSSIHEMSNNCKYMLVKKVYDRYTNTIKWYDILAKASFVIVLIISLIGLFVPPMNNPIYLLFAVLSIILSATFNLFLKSDVYKKSISELLRIMETNPNDEDFSNKLLSIYHLIEPIDIARARHDYTELLREYYTEEDLKNHNIADLISNHDKMVMTRERLIITVLSIVIFVTISFMLLFWIDNVPSKVSILIYIGILILIGLIAMFAEIIINNKNNENAKKKIKSKKKFFCLFILFIISGILLVDFLSFKFKQIQSVNLEDLKVSKEITLIGFVDSIGVPYLCDSKVSFFNLIEDDLRDGKYLEDSVNFFNLYFNKTWHIQGALTNNLTLGELVKAKNYGLHFNEQKFSNANLKFSELIDDNDNFNTKDIVLSNLIQEAEYPLFIYSCGGNDLFNYFYFNPLDFDLIDIYRLIKDHKICIKLMRKNIRHNIETILKLNKDSRIVLLGVYNPFKAYAPNRIVNPIVNIINNEIENIALQYEEVLYLDISFLTNYIYDNDFHPNSEGQQRMYANIVPLINQLCQNYDENYKYKVHYTEKAISKNNLNTVMINELSSFMVNRIKDELELVSTYVDASVLLELEILEYKETYKVEPDYIELNRIKKNVLDYLEKNCSVSCQMYSEAFDILIIERKIEHGMDYMINTYGDSERRNDKLSILN